MPVSQQELTAAVSNLANPLAASLGLALWGIEVALGPRSIVRVYVETGASGPVTIDECAELSRLLGLALEVEDCIPGAYMLEVSSPGLDRIFFTEQQLRRAVGSQVELSLIAPHPIAPGRRKFRGLLADENKGIFSLVVDESVRPGQAPLVLEFAFSALKKVRQSFAVPMAESEPGKKKHAGKKDKKNNNKPATAAVFEEEPLRPLTPEEEELLAITGGSEAL